MAACKSRAAAGEARRSATNQANAEEAGEAINESANVDSREIAAEEAEKRDLLRACEEEKRKCEQECDQAANQAAQDDNRNPGRNADGNTRADVENEKKRSCVAPMTGALGDIGAALAALGAAGLGALASGQASKGDKKDKNEESPGEAPKPECNTIDAARISECNNEYVQKCTSDVGAAGCDTFIDRYCSFTPGNNGTADQPIAPPPGNDSVVGTFSSRTSQPNFTFDVVGEGTTSDFCGMVAKLRDSKIFCQAAANAQCPSCKSGGSTAGFLQNTPDQMKDARNMCPGDPVFKDPQVISALNSGESMPSTGLESQSIDSNGMRNDASAGGGFGEDGSVQVGGATAFGAVNEGSGTKSWDLSTGGGGGGGGGGNSAYNPASVEEALRDRSGLITRKPAAAASAVAATDVAKQYGPSVFSISSETYQSLCSRRKLNCK